MITSKADLRRWGQLVNVIEFTTSIKMCVKGNSLFCGLHRVEVFGKILNEKTPAVRAHQLTAVRARMQFAHYKFAMHCAGTRV